MLPIKDSRGGRRRVIRTKDVENGHLHRAGDICLHAYVNAIAAVGRLRRGHNSNRWFRDPFPPTWYSTPSRFLHAVKATAFPHALSEL